MSVRLLLCWAILLATMEVALGQSAAYQLLGTWVDTQTQALDRWNARVRQTPIESVASPTSDTRPQLAGLRPKSVELLEDYFLQRHPRLLQGSPERARQLILRRYSRSPGLLRGYMAEAMFIDRNTEWNLVRNASAPQHDVTRQIPGRRAPFNGQIKYHTSGDPAVYARDMVKDYRAHRFFIPDDHVERTKAYLREKAERLQLRGDATGAKRLWRDYGRVRPIGASSTEIRTETRRAALNVAREQNAVYTSLGAAIGLSLAPTAYDLASGHMTSNVAAYHAARSFSLIGVGIGSDQLLARIGQGALRGGVRGNAVVGSAMAIAEIAWLLHEHGWQRAFYHPEFYEEAASGISALSLSLLGGTAATTFAAEAGVWAPVIVLGVGAVTGTVGYIGGKEATRSVLETLAPEFLRTRERQKIERVKEQIDSCIARLQALDGEGTTRCRGNIGET